MNKNLIELARTLGMMYDGNIRHVEYRQGILRLQIQTPRAKFWDPAFEHFQLVIGGCTKIYYHGYPKFGETCLITDLVHISRMGLGIDSVDHKMPNHFILFCNSYDRIMEEGEVHFNGGEFEIYDQEFGKVGYNNLRQVSKEWYLQLESPIR